VLSFSQALAWELAPRGVRVLAHCPGLTKTEFFEVGGIDVSLINVFWMTSERCVALGLRALDAGRRVIVTGWLNAIGAWLARIVPQRIVMAIAAWLYGPADRAGPK
jgi:short-subunit dehydrogenase